MNKVKIIEAIESELAYQDAKWAESQSGGRNHEIASWILYMEYHLERAKVAASTGWPETVALEDLRKVVALGVRCFMEYGVNPREYKV